MNKKLLAMVMVPILITMSGALAFSAFTGTLTTNVSANSGDFQLTEAANIADYNATNTVVSVAGPGGSMTAAGMAPLEQLGTAYLTSGMLTLSISITNLAPGDWVDLIFAVNNTGTVGAFLGTPMVSAPGWYTASFGASGVYNKSMDQGFAYANGSNSNGALAYFIYTGNAYTTSSTGPATSGVLSAGATAVFWLNFGLTSGANNAFSGASSETLTITIPVSSAP